MTTRNLFRWLVPVVAAGAVGCGGTPPTEPATLAPVIAAPVTDGGETKPTPAAQTPTQPTQPAKPADVPTSLPSDTGGKAVAKAMFVPPPLPAEPPAVTRRKAYSSALDRGELPLPPVTMKPFGPTEPKGSTAKPTPPAERHLPDSAVATLPEGRAADRPLAKAPAPPNAGAADVPQNAWRQNERASLDDPTTDLSAGRVIETPLPTAMVQLPFLRMTIPNPFEFGEQLKGKLGKDVELGAGLPK